MLYNPNLHFKIHDDATWNTSELLQKCRDKFPVYSYWNDEELDKEFPAPKSPTTRYFWKTVEADEKLANMSADDCEEKGIKIITIRERILMELAYFTETGKHLDINNITLCSGSRDSDGDVPRACWRGGWFGVYWSSRGRRDPFLRAREAVSLDPSPSSIPCDESLQEHAKPCCYFEHCNCPCHIKKPWYITGRGKVMKGDTKKSEGRMEFMGAYATEQEAKNARDEIKQKYGKK